ncbi:MAG: DNA-binding response regulator, partial [Dehalococcoidia bacterium]|nr:DNA-binding response regulator [Dehalococcoidia bacterium]
MVDAEQRIRIVIADQQPVFRQGIRSSLDSIADIQICGEVGSGHELLSTLNTL